MIGIYYPVFQIVQEVQRLSHSVALAPAEGVHAYLGKGVYLIRLFDLIWHFLFLLKTAIVTKYQVAFPFSHSSSINPSASPAVLYTRTY